MSNGGETQWKDFQEGGWTAHAILLVCSLLYMVNYMDRQVLSVVLEPMKRELGLSDTQAGLLQTAFLLSMAAFSFPAAFLVDRWSRRKAIAAMAVIWSAFTFITGLGKNFIGVLLPRLMVGAGEAGFSSGGIAMISAAYPSGARSRVMGIFNAAIPLGSGLGMMLGGYISQRFGGWRTPFYIFAIPGAMLAVAAWFLKDYKTIPEVDGSGRTVSFFASAISLFRIPSLKWLYLGIAMQNVMAFAFLVWSPAFIMRAQGVTEERAGLISGVIGLMAIVGAPIGGLLGDLWHRKNKRGKMYLPAASMFVSAGLFVVAIMLHVKGIGFIVGILLGVAMIMGLPALSAVTQDVTPPGRKGMAWGMCVFCMYAFGGGYSPIAVGAISDYLGGGLHGLKVALVLSSLGGVAAGVFYLLGALKYPADLEKVKHYVLEAE